MAGTDKELYGKEQQLLLAAKSLDQALIERDESLLDKVFDDNVVLHADKITVKDDITGAADVKKYYTGYWGRFEYEHSPIVTAANAEAAIAFTFAIDENVRMKSGGPGEPFLTVSIWAYEFTADLKVSGIWFLRTLGANEVEEHLKKPPSDLGLTAADYHKLREPQLPPDSGRTEALFKAAEQYSNLWATGKPSDSGSIIKDSFFEFDPLLGNTIKGASGLEHAIKSLGLMWESSSHTHQIAVTPDSLKAFVLWKQRGYFKETKKTDSLYGLNLIVFDEQHKIEKVAGFRQLMRVEEDKVLK